MSFIDTLLREQVATITLNRPERLNAFAGTMRHDLLEALLAAERDPACRAVVITGAGRAFCAGGDIEAMAALQKAGDVESFRTLLDAGGEVVLQIIGMNKPVLASINGVAAGAGCNLALACDYRIASEEAKLGQTFVRIGLHPDWGGTWLLPRLAGRGRAFELMATGRMIGAAEAAAMGMVDRVTPAGELASETARLAAVLAAAPPLPLAGIKRALREAERNDLRGQLALESEQQRRAFLSADAAEGMAAFFEKRAPLFRGE
ncbi:MAG TPA: enoyl-CoA hydratase-related protein [Thermoanaerobaculia bacterium]|nr:enoyl-CoA hydratase-related protein [Thermoanaerobaculia bacterium]